MGYEKKIEHTRVMFHLKNHFTEYGFKGTQVISCPNPNNVERLNRRFEMLINELCAYLKSNPSKIGLNVFGVKQIDAIDSNDFLVPEYIQLLACLASMYTFILDVSEPGLYFQRIKTANKPYKGIG